VAKVTLVSTLPFRLEEPKPGLIPSHFSVPAAEKGSISVLIIEDGFHQMLIPMSDPKAPPMRIPDSGESIAKSVIDDFIGACIAIGYEKQENGAVATPGLFFVPGALTVKEILTKHAAEVAQAQKNTNAWFQRLVVLADDEWQRTRQFKLITKLQRIACRHLGLEKEWSQDVLLRSSGVCWACKSPINPEAIICTACKAIVNQAEYDKHKTRFVA